MKSILNFCMGVCLAWLAQSCGLSQSSKQQVKSLDSLSGAVNNALRGMNKIDSNELNKTLKLFNDYAEFIRGKVNDTLSKTEALEIKDFFDSGTALQNYANNRLALQQRLKLVNKQISALAADIQNRALSDAQAFSFFQNEWIEVNQLMPIVESQEKQLYRHMQMLSQSLPHILEIIKNHNQQQLPIVVETQIR